MDFFHEANDLNKACYFVYFSKTTQNFFEKRFKII